MVCLQCIRVGIGWVARYQLCSCVSCGQCTPTTSSLPKCQLANWCIFRWPSSSTFSLPVFTSWWTGSTCYKTYLNYNGGLCLTVHVWSVRKLRGFCPILLNTYFKNFKVQSLWSKWGPSETLFPILEGSSHNLTLPFLSFNWFLFFCGCIVRFSFFKNSTVRHKLSVQNREFNQVQNNSFSS